MVSHRLDGSITRSYRPGSTGGAAAFSASHSGSRASSVSQSHPVPVRYSQPRAAGGASELMVSNPPPSAVDGGGRERRRGAHPLLQRGGAGQVGVELVLPHDREPGLDVVHPGGEQPPRPVGQQRDLLPQGDRERVDHVLRAPLDSGVHRLGGALDPLPGQRCQGAGDADRPLRRRRRAFRREVDVRREAPRAVHDARAPRAPRWWRRRHRSRRRRAGGPTATRSARPGRRRARRPAPWPGPARRPRAARAAARGRRGRSGRGRSGRS